MTVFYSCFGNNFRASASFFKNLDRKLATVDQNAYFSFFFPSCLDTIHIKQRSFAHWTKHQSITISKRSSHIALSVHFNTMITWHNLHHQLTQSSPSADNCLANESIHFDVDENLWQNPQVRLVGNNRMILCFAFCKSGEQHCCVTFRRAWLLFCCCCL